MKLIGVELTHMAEITPKRALAFVTDFIIEKRHQTNWVLMAGLVDYSLNDNPRLIRSQSFMDPDYPNCVLKFLSDIYERSPEDAKFVIGRIIRDGNEQDALLPQYRPAFEALSIVPQSGATMPVLLPTMKTKYLDIEKFPHDFYKELIDQINACYQYKLYPATQILIRKLLENCLIDVLRRRYGMANVNLFYSVHKGYFNDFSTLLETALTNIKDFVHVKDSFNEDLVKQIDTFREQGNSSAHNINLDAQEVLLGLDENRSKLNFIVKSLFRTIDNIK